jgi:hypothetical protein
LDILITLMMQELLSYETSVLTKDTWRNIPEDDIHYVENSLNSPIIAAL